MYNIIQLTDLHFTATDERSFDIDTRSNIDLILNEINKEDYDEIVITGDLAYRWAREDIYSDLKEKISNWVSKPIIVMAGNHDDSKMLDNYFPTKTEDTTNIEFFFSRNIEGFTILYLDTSHSVISDNQLHWINTKLETASTKVVIFMHHPPMYCNVKYMDKKYPLKNIDEIQNVLQNCSNEFYIFCGHYHVPKNFNYKNQHIYISPSTFFILNQDRESFQIESTQIGFRRIKISPNTISTSVKLLEGMKY